MFPLSASQNLASQSALYRGQSSYALQSATSSLANASSSTYTPDSEMGRFMDSINKSVTSAFRMDDGSSVLDWANGLDEQQAARKKTEAEDAAKKKASASGGSTLIESILTMMMSLLTASPDQRDSIDPNSAGTTMQELMNSMLNENS